MTICSERRRFELKERLDAAKAPKAAQASSLLLQSKQTGSLRYFKTTTPLWHHPLQGDFAKVTAL
jgi:hypothetical protein